MKHIGMIRNVKDSDSVNIEIPAELPFLQAICWHTENIRIFTLKEMLMCYETGWKYKGILADLEGDELDFVKKLARKIGSWINCYV